MKLLNLAARPFLALAFIGLIPALANAQVSIVSWGIDQNSVVSNTPTGTKFSQVAACIDYSIALRKNGSLKAWGNNFAGKVSNTPSGTGFMQVAANGHYVMALRTDGSIASWGYDTWGQVSNTPSGTGFTQVAAGGWHSLALRTDGSIVSWGVDDQGANDFGQVSDTPSGTGFTQVAAGPRHSLALRSDNNPGDAFCFGDGSGLACPCSMNGNSGEGCPNSSGLGGATLSGSGQASIAIDTFQLNVTGVPGNKPGLILRGAMQMNGGQGNPAGDGLLCVGGQTARSQVQVTSAGVTTFTNFQGQSFGASSYGVGVQTNYQFWYRDPSNTCSGSGFNLSNAWTTTWLP